MFGAHLRNRRRLPVNIEAMGAPLERERFMAPQRLPQSFLPNGQPEPLMEAERFAPARNDASMRPGPPNPDFAGPKAGFMGRLGEGLTTGEKFRLFGATLKDLGGGSTGNIAGVRQDIAARHKQALADQHLASLRDQAARMGPEAVALLDAGGAEAFTGLLQDLYKEELLRSRPEFKEVGGRYGTYQDGEFIEQGDVAPTASDDLAERRFGYERDVKDPRNWELDERRIANSEFATRDASARGWDTSRRAWRADARASARGGAGKGGGSGKPWDAYR